MVDKNQDNEKDFEQRPVNKNIFAKIFLINVCIFALMLLLFEFFFYFLSLYRMTQSFLYNHLNLNLHYYAYNIKMIPYLNYYKNKVVKYDLRNPDGLNYSKPPIILFGCSYTYGYNLEQNETFSYKLSEYTKRPVYNRGLNSTSIQHSIVQVQNDSVFHNINNPEYVIFTWNSSLLTFRLYRHIFNLWDKVFNPRFIIKNDDLVYEKPKLYQSFYIYKVLDQLKYKENNENLSEKDLRLVLFHFIKLKTLINNLYSNHPNFVILFYRQNDNCKIFDDKLKQKLQENGFVVLDTYDLTGIYLDGEYQLSPEDSHPNAKAWDLIVPKLAEKLNL